MLRVEALYTLYTLFLTATSFLLPPRDLYAKCTDGISRGCLNGGTCIKAGLISKCICPFGFTGVLCEKGLSTYVPKFNGESLLVVGLDSSSIREQYDMEIEILPYATSGLILYTAHLNNSDHTILFLRDGIFVYRFDCGSGSVEIKAGTKIYAGKTAKVTLGRDERRGYISVNGEGYMSALSPGNKTKVESSGIWYVGGFIPSSVEARHKNNYATDHSGYQGCILSLKVDDQYVSFQNMSSFNNIFASIGIGDCSSSICKRSPCNKGTCVPRTLHAHKCICPLGTSGENCTVDISHLRVDFIPFFTGESYVQYVYQPSKDIFIELAIKPESRNGVILYTSQNLKDHADFLVLMMTDGFIEAILDLGSGPMTIKSADRIATGTWSTITLLQNSQMLVLTLKDQPKKEVKINSRYRQLNTDNIVHIGGYEHLTAIPVSGREMQNFQGCIAQVSINYGMHLVRDALQGVNIQKCNHTCNSNLRFCEPNGRCIADEDEYICACNLGFGGPNCNHELPHAKIPFFKGFSYLLMDDQAILQSVNSNFWDIRINVRAACVNCLILWAGTTELYHHGDYLAIGIGSKKQVEVRYNLGGNEISFNYSHTVPDNSWQLIRLARRENFATLKVGNHETALISSERRKFNTFNSGTGIYLGGLEPGKGFTNLQPFIGCIEYLEINSQAINVIESSSKGENIEDCSV